MSPEEMCERISRQDQAGRTELYRRLTEDGTLFFLLRELKSDGHDALHELWIDLVCRIEQHKIEHPEQVFVYARKMARTIVNRRIRARLRLVPEREQLAA